MKVLLSGKWVQVSISLTRTLSKFRPVEIKIGNFEVFTYVHISLKRLTILSYFVYLKMKNELSASKK